MMSYTFKQNLLSSSKYPLKAPYTMSPEYITVHNTSNDATAENEMKYMISNNNQVSYHVAVDDKEVIQGIPFNRNAWHCGDGHGNGNRKSIGIEICFSKSGGKCYEQAEENAVLYIAKLLKEFGWGIDRVRKHQDWNNKYCPHRILDEGRWNSFLKRIEKALEEFKVGEEEMIFSSKAMKEKYEIRTNSQATKKLLLETALSIEELQLDRKHWEEQYKKGNIKEGDWNAFAYEVAVHLAKKTEFTKK